MALGKETKCVTAAVQRYDIAFDPFYLFYLPLVLLSLFMGVLSCIFVWLFLQECDDPCCNARTCRPRDGAQCTKGECCTSTCQFKAYGTRCRSSSGQCDIEEYCSGESSECPADVYKQDGTSCNNNQAYCFSGECQTYDDQCQYHFGSSE